MGALITLPLWILLFNAYGLYAAGLRRVGHATVDDIPAMAHAFLVGAVGLWLYFQITPAGKLRLLRAARVRRALRSCSGSRCVRGARKLGLRRFGAERVLFVGSGPDDADPGAPDAAPAPSRPGTGRRR